MPNEPVKISELMPEPEKVLGEAKRGKLKASAPFDVSFLEVATRLVAAGMNETEVGFFLGASPAKIKQWKRKFPLFKKACEDGKRIAKAYLIAQGLRAAAGYDYTEKNVKVKTKLTVDGEIEEYPAERSEFHKHQKPDPTLLMFMLSNLSRQLHEEEPWTSQHKVEVDDNRQVNIHIQGKVASDQIARLAGAFLNQEVIEAEFEDGKSTVDKGTGKPRSLTGGNTKGSKRKHKVEDEAPRTDGT